MDHISIKFDKEEIDILDAAFEVLVESGVYMMFGTPENKVAHAKLYKKFHDAMKIIEMMNKDKI